MLVTLGSECKLSGTGKVISNGDMDVEDATFTQTGGSVVLAGASTTTISGGSGKYILNTGGTFSGDTVNISLELAGGASLVLQDGNQTNGAALYVGEVFGAAIAGNAVSNITGNGYTIYYDASLNGNTYLGGKTFSLQGGGLLMAAAPVPEPTGCGLLLAGLGLIGGRVLRSKARVAN